MSNWKPFHFETNQVFGNINTREDWDEFRRRYEAAYSGSIWNLKQNEFASRADFGQRMEHKGSKTLGMFFDENNMERC